MFAGHVQGRSKLTRRETCWLGEKGNIREQSGPLLYIPETSGPSWRLYTCTLFLFNPLIDAQAHVTFCDTPVLEVSFLYCGCVDRGTPASEHFPRHVSDGAVDARRNLILYLLSISGLILFCLLALEPYTSLSIMPKLAPGSHILITGANG